MFGMVENSYEINVILNNHGFFKVYIPMYANKSKQKFLVEELQRAFTADKGYSIEINAVYCHSEEVKKI